MPGSTASLESLSSPSPSPPPQEEQRSNHSGAAGLDSGSELSELTEEEQDNDNRANDDDTTRPATRKKKQQGHIVPEDMWGWALKKKKPEKKEKDWRNKFEEEEEEEQAGPAKAMEEEEEDDQDKGMDSDGDVFPDKDGALSDNENEVAEVDEDDPPEEEGESGDETLPANVTIGEISGDENDEAEDADADADLDGPEVQQSPKAVASPDLTDDENDNVGEEEIDEDDAQEAEPTTKEGSEVDEYDDDAVPDDVDVPDVDEPPTTEAVTPANGVDDAVDMDPDATMEVDVPAQTMLSPVAASSIMAGASLVHPLSPSYSQASSPSGSRASSAEQEQEQDIPSEPEAEPEPERKTAGVRGGRARKGKGRTRAPRRSRVAAADPGEADVDAEQLGPAEGEGLDAEDDVATPDLDLDSDMQPAHRAEALDVLAQIELKFALLRERLYVEKMDSLAWEEGLIVDGTHPELLHLHAELSNRRDKRLELAARRRDYEVENVRKRRRLDEAGTWSTWKHERDGLQKQMIAETNGRKRKLERERKIVERPPPARRFPMPLHEVSSAPTLREIVKSSPFGLPDSAASLGKRARKKDLTSQVSLAYPTLLPLSRNEILQDLDVFYNHPRHAAPGGFDPHRHMPGLMNAVLSGGIPHGIDPYVMGMQVVDGPARYGPPVQQHLHQPGVLQSFGLPRLPHNHSAPPGGIPHVSHAQMQMEQEMQAAMRQPPPHPSQFGPGPVPVMRRSISPVPLNGAAGSSSMPTTNGGGPVPPGFSGLKPNGWSGPPSGGKESKRLNGEVDGRERERMNEVMSQRDRVERERAREVDREREAERAYHMSHAPRHNAHQHPHQHAHGNAQGQPGHHHPAHNHQHHHHHHVVHHHHPPPQGFNGPGSNAHAPPPMTGLPPGPGGPQILSPHSLREFEQRRPRSGAPTEVIELSASGPKQQHGASPRSPAFWQGNEEPLPIEHQRDRDRGRAASGPLGPPPPGQNEHLMTPFTMGPSQTLQRSLPGSPGNQLVNLGHANPPPPSMPTSRRGSWSAIVDDRGLPRPASGSGIGPSGNQRAPTTRLPHPSSTSFHSPYDSPPRSNGRALPPVSPSTGAYPGPQRSPVRSSQHGRMPLGGPLSPPPSLPRSPLMGSPGSKLPRAPSPGILKVPPKMGGFPIPESGNIAPIATASGASVLPSPATLLPPLSSLPAPGVPPPRMSNGTLPEKMPPQLQGVPLPTKVVPVDGP